VAGDSRTDGLPKRPRTDRDVARPEPAAPPEVPKVGLVGALRGVRDELTRVRFPLALPDAEESAATARSLVAQLDDYLLPRLARLDAPLLVVVGGSTGVGKSTLVNSVVRAPVTQAGVLRPTTRAPVLVSAPPDARWFLGPAGKDDTEPHLLPGLRRTTALSTEIGALRVISATGLPRGLALLDAPDIDSVETANREVAQKVLSAADLWLFVTTASRYADAVPWDALRTARDRGTRLAVVLNRVPEGAEEDLGTHLREMLDAEGLPAVELFILPEVALDGQGMVSEDRVIPLRDWLVQLAEKPAGRVRLVGDTLGGALAALRWSAEGLATAIDRQHAAADALRTAVNREYGAALSTVESALAEGTLLRGEILVRWREFVADGEFHEAIAAAAGRRKRIGAAVTGKAPPGGKLQGALASGLVTLVAEAVAGAADRTRAAWTGNPAGGALLTGVERPGRRTERVRALVRDWRETVLEVAGGDVGRRIPYAVHVTSLLIMLGVLGGELPEEAAEPGAARVLSDPALRTLITSSREDLLARVRELLATDAARFADRLTVVDMTAGSADRLRAALRAGATA
jgi:dynamin family protein